MDKKEVMCMDIRNITVTNINGILNVYSEKGRRLNIVRRKYYGLSFCKSGKIEYVQNGVKTISDNTCAIILPKGQRYDLFGTETGEFPLINFDTAYPFTESFLRIPLHNPEAYIREFERLSAIWQNPYSRAKALSILYDLLDRLSHEESEANYLLSPVLKYISEHFADRELSNTELAAAANVSEVYLRRLFSKELGTTPKQYILDLRLRYAKQLLAEKAFTVTGISEKCGFSSVYHFCRAFKSFTGQTPTEYSSSVERIKG